MKRVEFWYLTGVKRRIFHHARLVGSWDETGHFSDLWSARSMEERIGEDGCPAFYSFVDFPDHEIGTTFTWGVLLDGSQRANFWGISTEVQDVNSTDRHRHFTLSDGTGDSVQRYYFTYCRYLGAHKFFEAPGSQPTLRFSVWAPNAQQVEVVFGLPTSGYIFDDGSGIDSSRNVIALSKKSQGIWQSDPLVDFREYERLPYMYRIKNNHGHTVFRTDIFSRGQIGCGGINPANGNWPGTIETLDGTKSCSLIIDPDTVTRDFIPPPDTPIVRIPVDDFWAHEFTAGLPVPTRIEDLVIYELHIGALGFGKNRPGNLEDAFGFLDHLVDLGVNAVELLPMSEFSGNVGWGYGDTHHFLIETSAGGRDQYKHFVRECHRRGIAVIQDVVYNHYDNDAERAQWQYDSSEPGENIYYWYEGIPTDYPNSNGGYLNNGSTGYTPRFWEEVVRQQFISSAVFLVEEMHVDGLRVDLTQAIHRDNTLNANGKSIGNANIFGQKLLREWSRTLNMIHPTVMLVAEDHTDWDAVTKVPAAGGLGFNATWFARFYHNLVGDSHMSGDAAHLLKDAGTGENGPLKMDDFAGVLYDTKQRKVVYHESHDEAGNAGGSLRTILAAVNDAPLWGETRVVAEARSRVVFGLSLFSAGTPMFFMGEEIGAQKYYTHNNFLNLNANIDNREDIPRERSGNGKNLFRFYQDAITLSRRLPSIRSHNIDILHQSTDNRVIAFKRWLDQEEVIIFASLNNFPFLSGYEISKDLLAIPNAGWKELFNSDAAIYGGKNIGNAGATLFSNHGRLKVIIPANGLTVFVRR